MAYYGAVCRIPKHLKKEEIDKIKKQFLAIDEDGSGEISIKELRSLLQDPKLKMKEEEIDEWIVKADLNRSGTFDLCEFLNMMAEHKNRELIHRAIMHRSTIRRAFKLLDKDGNGYLSKKELRQAMNKQKIKITDETFNAMFEDSDINKDGRIDYNEFIMIMTS